MKKQIRDKFEDVSFTISDALISVIEFHNKGGWRGVVIPLMSSIIGSLIGVLVATQIAIHCFW